MGVKNKGFTLAEVLITLGIIGIVAAMTIPTLMKAYEKKVTVTKLKKVYSILNQAVLKSAADNGPASEFLLANTYTNADSTSEFINTYWLPYFKSPKTYAAYKLYSDYKPWKYLNNSVFDVSVEDDKTTRVLFQTNDGITYFITFAYYNMENVDGRAVRRDKYAMQQTIYVDINGINKPNTFGKDVFVFIADFSKNYVVPCGYALPVSTINSNCKSNNSGTYCAAKIMKDNWEIKSDYPW